LNDWLKADDGALKSALNEEAGCKPEEWKDFLWPYSPPDPGTGLGGIFSLGWFCPKSRTILGENPDS
jgi:hypothetical protein